MAKSMFNKKSAREMELEVENFNIKHSVGTAVKVKKDNGTTIDTVTTSEAYIMGGHTAVVHLRDISGCYALDRVTAQ